MSSNRKAIIIGAGISGLSAGCYLQMNGYETQIFEHHSVPGGLCTGWKRKDYTVEGCMEWLVGTNPEDPIYNVWNEIIDMDKLEVHNSAEYIRYKGKDGKEIVFYKDIEKLEKELLEKAPEDKSHIMDFTKAVKKLMKFELGIDTPDELKTFKDKFNFFKKSFPFMGTIKKFLKISIGDYAKKFKNEDLRDAFSKLFVPEMSTLFIVMTFVWMTKKNAGYPTGGSLHFSQLIAERFRKLGGKIHYKTTVEKIVNKNGIAKAIELKNGNFYEADLIISACDGYNTIFNMLEGKYLDSKIKSYYNTFPVFPSYLQVSIGVARTFDKDSSHVVFKLDKPLVVDDTQSDETLSVRIFNFDKTLAPKGKTLLTVLIPTRNYMYWTNLKEHNIKKYKSEKERIAKDVVEILESKLGKIKGKVEIYDVSTPATVIRYTLNWQGSLEGWIWSPKVGLTRMKKTLPGLKNFYMIGQWVQPGGGLPSAIMSARSAVQLICAEDKKEFTITKPVETIKGKK